MEITEGRAQELDESVRASFKSAGIGSLYWAKTKSLANCGKAGKKLFDDFASGELVEAARAGVGVFIQGQGMKALELQMLVCRAFVLAGVATKSVTLPYFASLMVEGGDDWLALLRTRVLCIQSFYDPFFPEAFANDRAFPIECQLRGALEGDKALILQSPVAPQACAWWSPTLREMIDARTLKYQA